MSLPSYCCNFIIYFLDFFFDLFLEREVFSYIIARKDYIWWDDDDVHFVTDQQAKLDFNCNNSLKRQSASRHVDQFYSLWLDKQGLAATIYCTRYECTNHYITLCRCAVPDLTRGSIGWSLGPQNLGGSGQGVWYFQQ